MIKSRRMGWVGDKVHIDEMENACKILIMKPKDQDTDWKY
jgi:hypothetical protein